MKLSKADNTSGINETKFFSGFQWRDEKIRSSSFKKKYGLLSNDEETEICKCRQ